MKPLPRSFLCSLLLLGPPLPAQAEPEPTPAAAVPAAAATAESAQAAPAPAEPAKPAPDGGPLKVGDRLTFSGDFRYRHESNFELDDQESRHRERIRFRLQADFLIQEGLVAGARLRTGNPEDPKSPHQTLGDGFDSFELNLDRAFVTYRPPQVQGLWLTGGKFGHPFTANPIYGELVWDADVQAEGIAVGHAFRKEGRVETVTLTGGEYLLLEASASDTLATVAQAGMRVRLAEKTFLQTAAGYYGYGDLTPDSATTLFAENLGNATVDTDGDLVADDYASDFDIWNALLAVSFTGWKVPMTLSGEYILNSSAEIDGDTGWAAGVAFGRTAAARDWQAYYQYQKVEQDAVLSLVSQDDFLFTTNHQSHVAGFRYRLGRPVELHVWALVSQRVVPGTTVTTDSTDNQWRARLDFTFQF